MKLLFLLTLLFCSCGSRVYYPNGRPAFKYMGWTIPQPVWIVFTVLAGIFLIVWLARIFGFAT